jgi:hypothetical protein
MEDAQRSGYAVQLQHIPGARQHVGQRRRPSLPYAPGTSCDKIPLPAFSPQSSRLSMLASTAKRRAFVTCQHTLLDL